MAENKDSLLDTNVFIDFQIIKESDLNSLSQELDVLIAGGKKIHIWSKTITPRTMKRYCETKVVPTPKEEKDLHKKIYELRHKDRKTFEEISKLVDIPITKVSYYAKANPNREWVLNDWIEGYLEKDPSFYNKVDYLVDPDERLVNKFKRAGRKANCITRI